MIDEIDKKIIYELLGDCRISAEALAPRVGLSATPLRRRIKRLEETGIIAGYTVNVDLAKCGLRQPLFVHVKLQSRDRATITSFESKVREEARILSCHLVTGSFDYLIELQMPDMESYNAFLKEVLADLPGVFGIETNVVVGRVKSRHSHLG